MSILSGIKAMFGRKEESSEITLETLANIPVYQMIQEEAPFSDWRYPDAEIPEGLEDTFKVCVWMYQMYGFYILIAKRFGYEIADKVLKYQVERLSKASEELGKQLENAIRQIHEIIAKQANEPFVREVNGKRIGLPIEISIALEFLLIGKDAPFHADPEELKAGKMPEMNGADIALAECLNYGMHSAQSKYQGITVIKVVL